jgi:glucose/arabinose dehydrogenase
MTMTSVICVTPGAYYWIIVNRLLVATLLCCLAACSGGGGSADESGLAVSINGLPPGADADIVITGPGGFNRSIIAAQTLANLPAGTYTLTAGTVVNGSAVFIPRVTTQSVAVSSSGRATAAVTYDRNGTLQLRLELIASSLAAPVFLTAPVGDPRLFFLERAGRIRLIKNGAVLPTPVLDISARVRTDGERGLLSLAFDPQFATNGFLYINFTDLTGDVQVERFQIPSGTPDVADRTPLRILTVQRNPANNNHNGGQLVFGADGFLYVGVGDGGGAGDPFNNAQNLNTLLGKLLRIDVANATSLQPYAIPLGNPFAGQAGRRAEIWAYGLRNPWRYAFDTARGLLYIADVGEARREEVDVAAATAAALNYGWNIMEGSLCFAVVNCSTQGLTLPVLEYGHDPSGGCSIIGGFVYRGGDLKELRGRFFYSDFCAGFLRSFRFGGGQAAEQIDWNIQNIGQVTSFGEDAAGELYMLTSGNAIYKIVRQ